jgi:thermitase
MARANKNLLLVGLALVLGIAPLPYSPVSGSHNSKKELMLPARAEYVLGEVLVKFKSQVPAHERAQALSAVGVRVSAPLDNGVAVIKLADGEAVEAALQSLRRHGEVDYVQPNYVYRKLAAPNDTHYAQLWGLKNTSVPGNDMDLEQAWDYQSDCSSVVVAVVDSGINYTHQDLAANMWDGTARGFPNHGYDYAEGGDNDPFPTDGDAHGTHVAGTIGAVGNNGRGTTGICWQAKIMALRVFHNDVSDTVRVVQALQFAVANGAKVINMSLGGGGNDAVFAAQVDTARNNGVLIIAAAGNSNSNNDTTPTYPCNFPHDNVVCVAALDQNYNRASFSNYGASSVDVAAPGAGILSTWPGATITENFSTGWTMDAGWAGVTCNLVAGSFSTLVNPANQCTAANSAYSNNSNAVAYKQFDLSGTLGVRLNFFEYRDLEAGADFVDLNIRSSSGNPFAGGTALYGTGHTGSSGGFFEFQSENLSACLNAAACSVGFRLRSNASIAGEGTGILLFEINTASAGANVYESSSGTSMAAPHVAGLAALIKAYNPAFTYIDLANAIKHGGNSVAAMSGITTTGRAVSASGSLRYINAPTNLTAVVQ